MLRSIAAAVIAAVLLATPVVIRPAAAESTMDAIQSTLYFGLKSPQGGVSEQEWAAFLADEVTPRFPDGLTVLSAYGQGASTPPAQDRMIRETTKVLIIVHPDTPEASAKLAELKKIYKEQFTQSGVFHTRQPVQVVSD